MKNFCLQEFNGSETPGKKKSGRAAERPVGEGGASVVPQGPLERRPCSPSTNCTAPGPRTAARADRRTGERAGERGPGASWAPARGAFKILGISLLLIDLQHHIIYAAFN